MRKATTSEMILTIGILVAVGIILLQLRGVFYAQQKLGQEEAIFTFAKTLEDRIDKAIAVTGNVHFTFHPKIKKYKLTIKGNMITIYDKVSKETTSFVKTGIDFHPTTIEDYEVIDINKIGNTIYLSGK
jgi:hypothetical protein